MSVKWIFVGTSFDNLACIVQSPLFTHPHFNSSEIFFSFVAPPQRIELSPLTTTLNIYLSERWSNFLRGTKVIKAAHGFKCSVAMRTETIHTESLIFSLCVLYRRSLICNMFFFVENRTWPIFRSNGSCFVEVWIYLSLDRDPNAYKHRWV